MKTDIWMPLYINDYLADTAHLTAEESGAYLHMIMHYWKKGFLENNLSRVSRVSKSTEEVTQIILSEFFILTDGKWTHDRINKELKNANSRRDSARENGKKGGRPPKTRNPQKTYGLNGGFKTETHDEPTNKADDNPQESSSSSSSSSKLNTSSKEKNTKKETVIFQPEEFESESRPDYSQQFENLINEWNNSGLPNCGNSLTVPNAGECLNSIKAFGFEYISETIKILSENKKEIGKYLPSFKSLMSNGSMGKWHDYEPEKKKTKIDISKIEEASFDNF